MSQLHNITRSPVYKPTRPPVEKIRLGPSTVFDEPLVDGDTVTFGGDPDVTFNTDPDVTW